MKQFITILLFFTLTLSLCSCSDNNQITLTLPTGEVTGTYTGDMEQKLPHGIGTFECADETGVIWTYSGEWSNGLMSGEGKMEMANGRTYDGEFLDGVLHGIVSVYETNSLLFTAVYEDGNIMGLVRQIVAAPNDEPMQYIKVGHVGFCIPKTWSCDVVNDSIAYVQIPGADNVQVIFSISEYMDGGKDSTRTTIKEAYLKEYGVGYTQYLIASESKGGFFGSSDEYDVQLTFFNGENILDVFSHSLFRDSILSEPATYTVTTIIDGGVYDYSEAAQYITYTMKNWDAIQEDLAEAQADQANQDISTMLQGNIDWTQLESVLEPITEQSFLDRIPTESRFGLVEGIIDNISDDSFDIWLPHNGTYSHRESWPRTDDFGDIQDGAKVQVCIETHDDCSLKKVRAIRVVDAPLISDMVTEFKNTCTSIDYQKIMRNPDVAYGTIWKARGTVLQVVETKDNMQEFLLELSDGNCVYVDYYKEPGSDNIVEGDSVTVYGTFYMTKTYLTLLSGEKTVPKLAVDYITIH